MDFMALRLRAIVYTSKPRGLILKHDNCHFNRLVASTDYFVIRTGMEPISRALSGVLRCWKPGSSSSVGRWGTTPTTTGRQGK
jgi:hypothetical protein